MAPTTRWIHRWLVVTVMALFALGTAVISGAQGTSPSLCPSGQGYWKNTPAWPVVQLTLGSQTYSQAELLIILNTPSTGDASLILAHQLIAARLNQAGGSDISTISGIMAAADALLAGFPGKLPYNLAPSSAQGQAATSSASVLDIYNNGGLTVGCGATPTPTPEATPESTPDATPEATPEMTPDPDDDLPITIVIEGPVQTININIITIYDIDIELDDDDPSLNIIQIGDVVHVEGNVQNMNGAIVIIAINIVIVNVDINVDTGEFWRDDGACGNPPPPWAPANGWRRRCETDQSNDSSKKGSKKS